MFTAAPAQQGVAASVATADHAQSAAPGLRPSFANAQEGSKLPAQRSDLQGLVDEGAAQAQCRRLQGQALVAAPRLNPVRLVVGLGIEHGDGRSAADVAAVLLILARGREPEAHEQPAQPARHIEGCP